MDINKVELLQAVRELILSKNIKIDNAGIITPEMKSSSEGYIEALYQVESLIINFDKQELL